MSKLSLTSTVTGSSAGAIGVRMASLRWRSGSLFRLEGGRLRGGERSKGGRRSCAVGRHECDGVRPRRRSWEGRVRWTFFTPTGAVWRSRQTSTCASLYTACVELRQRFDTLASWTAFEPFLPLYACDQPADPPDQDACAIYTRVRRPRFAERSRGSSAEGVDKPCSRLILFRRFSPSASSSVSH